MATTPAPYPPPTSPAPVCNSGAFGELVDSTLNFTGGYAAGIGGNFSSARAQLLGNLDEYRALQNKGYLYTAADYAFLDFPKALTLYDAYNLTPAKAGLLESNVSSYCSSLVPPPLTDANYEYVVGGELRHYWANITLNESQATLGSVQTTDDVAQSVYESAQALGWCRAADVQYRIASSLGGNYVDVSPAAKAYAKSLMGGQAGLGNSIYSQSAAQAYASGDYAAALYAAEYENAFGRPFPNLTDSQLRGAVRANIGNATSGDWPSEFSSHAEFYINEANLAKDNATERGYLLQAYSTSVLAGGIAAANEKLSGSFVASNSIPSGVIAQELNGLQQSVAALQQELSEIYAVMLVVLVLLLALLAVILALLLRHGKETGRPPEAIKGRGRGRR